MPETRLRRNASWRADGTIYQADRLNLPWLALSSPRFRRGQKRRPGRFTIFGSSRRGRLTEPALKASSPTSADSYIRSFPPRRIGSRAVEGRRIQEDLLRPRAGESKATPGHTRRHPARTAVDRRLGQRVGSTRRSHSSCRRCLRSTWWRPEQPWPARTTCQRYHARRRSPGTSRPRCRRRAVCRAAAPRTDGSTRRPVPGRALNAGSALRRRSRPSLHSTSLPGKQVGHCAVPRRNATGPLERLAR
ncbi:hypothetical protein HD597_000535 [Nonomuraea thailandensis]|uniref:Uncharacterized protein n=1 Tax=Nonomuraea thailandensis TaxID=1188745 RepID=A0A9X2JZA1_9ACTN|nr:hypothetical protein [Nonomuraea thailandensis]